MVEGVVKFPSLSCESTHYRMSDILIALSWIHMLADYNLITNPTTDYVAQT